MVGEDAPGDGYQSGIGLDKDHHIFQQNRNGNGHVEGNGGISEMDGTRDPVELNV